MPRLVTRLPAVTRLPVVENHSLNRHVDAILRFLRREMLLVIVQMIFSRWREAVEQAWPAGGDLVSTGLAGGCLRVEEFSGASLKNRVNFSIWRI